MTSSGRVKKQRKTSGVEEVNRKEVIERSGENKYRKEVTEGAIRRIRTIIIITNEEN